VQALNNCSTDPWWTPPGWQKRRDGGRHPRGQAVITAFHRVRTEIEATLAKLESNLGAESASDLFWSLGCGPAPETPAGKISHITPGAVAPR